MESGDSRDRVINRERIDAAAAGRVVFGTRGQGANAAIAAHTLTGLLSVGRPDFSLAHLSASFKKALLIIKRRTDSDDEKIRETRVRVSKSEQKHRLSGGKKNQQIFRISSLPQACRCRSINVDPNTNKNGAGGG